jgi:hypothetical protein
MRILDLFSGTHSALSALSGQRRPPARPRGGGTGQRPPSRYPVRPPPVGPHRLPAEAGACGPLAVGVGGRRAGGAELDRPRQICGHRAF